jgi:hypothetical protein
LKYSCFKVYFKGEEVDLNSKLQTENSPVTKSFLEHEEGF